MGYCFDYAGRLVCDRCGQAGGVRKRKCPYKVSGLHYCPAPAYCAPCYKVRGGLRGVHGDACRDGAAASQAKADVIRARLDAGEVKVRAAYGDWHADVPAGMTMLLGSDDKHYLLPKNNYGHGGFITDYPTAVAVGGA